MIELLSPYKHIKYEDIKIGKLLDTGNVSVYRGKYFNLDVAIKVYKYDENNIREHIINELDISHNIKSERLMKIYGYSYNKDKSLLYLIMEYINSKDLYTYLENTQYYTHIDDIVGRDNYPYIDTTGYWSFTMTRKTKLSIIISFLKAIKSMWYEGIIHGDLKSLNLAIHRKDNDIYIKIIDYGTCQKNHSEIDYCCSTDGYVSPELNYEPYILSHKSDIYAIGVIMTEIWFGYIDQADYKESRNYLFRQLRIMKNHDPDMEKIIRKCVLIDPDKRPDIYKLYNMVSSIE